MDMDTTYRCTYKSKHIYIYSIWCLCSGFMISSNSVTLALEDPIRAQHVSRLKTVQLSGRQPMRDQWTRRKAKKALPTCWVFFPPVFPDKWHQIASGNLSGSKTPFRTCASFGLLIQFISIEVDSLYLHPRSFWPPVL